MNGIQAGIGGEKVMLASDKFILGSQVFIVHAVLPFGEVIDLSVASLSATSVFVIIPCGLIINELLLNALKHAVPHMVSGSKV